MTRYRLSVPNLVRDHAGRFWTARSLQLPPGVELYHLTRVRPALLGWWQSAETWITADRAAFEEIGA